MDFRFRRYFAKVLDGNRADMECSGLYCVGLLRLLGFFCVLAAHASFVLTDPGDYRRNPRFSIFGAWRFEKLPNGRLGSRKEPTFWLG